MRNSRFFGSVVLIISALIISAGAQEKKVANYETPEELFDAFLMAWKKDDMKALFECYSPEIQSDLLNSTVFDALKQQHAAHGNNEFSKRIRKDYKEVLDTLDRHGLKYEVTKSLKIGKTPDEKKKARAELAQFIEDPARLWADLLAGYNKTLNKPKPQEIKGELTDLKEKGDKAKGVVFIMVDGKELKGPIEFTKIGNGWKIAVLPKGFY